MLDKTSDNNVAQVMRDIGKRARNAAAIMALAAGGDKNRALVAMAAALGRHSAAIFKANQLDVDQGIGAGLTQPFVDRLKLTTERLDAMATALTEIAALPDPVGAVIANWQQPNGLAIERVRTPLGVVGVIFESRPNVTSDAAALCLKSGNAVILRGGSDSFHSSRAIHAALLSGLEQAGLPVDAVQIVPTTDRAAVGEILAGLNGAIDVIVPRGGKSLVGRVQDEARVPVFAHLEGICHVYVDGSADLEMARRITVNAKMRRTSICGAAETLLVDRAAKHLVAPILGDLTKEGCLIRASAEIMELFGGCEPANQDDWSREYGDAIISVCLVDGVGGAIDHIRRYSSHHTETIIGEELHAAERFLREVDSAIVMHNVSTQFADGGEFGMGGEIGIATGKLHARGPVGVEQLTSFKYQVRGSGQVRP